MLNRLLKSRAVAALSILAARILGAGLGLAVSLLMARAMPLDQMGSALTAMSVATLLPILASGSLEIGATRFLTQALHGGRQAEAAGFVAFTWRAAMIGVPTLAIVGGAVALLAAPAGQGIAFALALVAAAVLGIVRVGAAHAAGFARVVLATVPNSLVRPALLLALLALSLASGVPATATTVLGSFLVAALGTLLFQQLMLAPSYRTLRGITPDRSPSRAWLAYGLQMGATMMFIEYSKEITVLLSATRLQPDQVAMLSVALSFVGFARFGIVAVNQSVVPDLSRALGQNDVARLVAVVDRSNWMRLGVAGASLLGFGLLADDLMGFYSPAFVAAAPVLHILMWEPVLMAILGPSQNVLSLSGHQRVLLGASLVMVPVLAGLVTIGAQSGGVMGAGLGATLGWALYFAFLARRLQRQLNLDLTLLGTVRRQMRRGGVTLP